MSKVIHVLLWNWLVSLCIHVGQTVPVCSLELCIKSHLYIYYTHGLLHHIQRMHGKVYDIIMREITNYACQNL